jgi:hypothetical protein
MTTGNIEIPFGTPEPWVSFEQREVPLPLERVRQTLPRIIEAASSIPLTETAPCRWRGTLRGGRSLFDCVVMAEAQAIDNDGMGTHVELRFQFDHGPVKLTLSVWLVATLIGIPVASRWRAWSTRSAQRLMSHTFEEVWAELGALAEHPYR